jgi:thioester reductase-like protein
VSEKDAATVDIAGVRQQLKQELPGYMIPAQVIPVNKIPVTENGKTDRKRLAELAETDSREVLLSEPPTNETEQIMVDIWSETLRRPIVNITDNFFDIGGDSLLVAVVVTAMGRRLNVKIYMRDIYQYPVLQQLADLLIARAKETSAAVPGEDVEPYVELKNDVYLAPGTVFAGGFDPERAQNPSAIFLTGATGFVGIHLLQELLDTTHADVYCLVRAQDVFHAMEKINHCFAEYRIEGDAAQRQRIIPVIGDLTVSFLGLSPDRFDFLSKHIDIIYHSGSSVNFIEPYSYMKAPNVEGLREIIRFAGAGRTKCLALLSTISVYSWGHVFTHKTTMFETDDIEQNLLAASKDIGYVRSKWVMEAIADLASREGLPVITYRLGYAMCHSKTGASAPYQWWAGLVKNCIEFKSYPLLTELREGLITVDYMTRSIAHISKNADAIGRKFNLIARPETNLTLKDFFGLLRAYYPFVLKELPYKEWRRQWEDDNSNRLFPLTSLFKDNMHEGLSTVELYQHTYIWDCAQVTRFLEGSGIEEPVFDKQLLDAYLAYLEIPMQ